MRYARLSAQVDGAAYPCRVQGACAPHCTRRRDNAHKIEELEVLYQWHPWFGRVVHVHEVIEQRASGVLRCSPDGDASRRWLELPQWMFDRAACLAIGMAASPRVDTAAIEADDQRPHAVQQDRRPPPDHVGDIAERDITDDAADAPKLHAPADIRNGRGALDALFFEQQALNRRQPSLGRPYRQQRPQREKHADQRLETNATAEQLQRHYA